MKDLANQKKVKEYEDMKKMMFDERIQKEK
jgi:hypothetical protein